MWSEGKFTLVKISIRSTCVQNVIALSIKSLCKLILFGVCGKKEERKLNCSSTRHFSNCTVIMDS